jgi:hypothetical protein
VTRSKNSGSLFSIATREHPKTRFLVGVKGGSELVWWLSSVSSLEDCSSHVFSGAPVVALLDHKKFDEVVVCLADGQVLLFNLSSRSVVSQIGDPKAKIRTVWSGLYSLSKIAHILLVVFDESLKTHHLRVIRLTSKRVDEKDAPVLEHVCAHLLVQPAHDVVAPSADISGKKKKRGSAKETIAAVALPVIVSAAFDVAGLTLSCVWSVVGVFASYAFSRTKHLASLEVNLPPKLPTSQLKIRADAIESLRLVAFRQNHVCVLIGNVIGVVNTSFGAVVSSLNLDLDEKSDSIVSFIAASNDSLFLLATKSTVMRINVAEPDSYLLASCIGSAVLTESIFGPQKGVKQEESVVDYVFSVVDGVGTVSPDPPFAMPSSASKLSELLSSRCVPGVGFAVRGAARVKDVSRDALDTYSLTPEFGSAAALEFCKRKDWASVDRIVQARLFALPPSGVVEAAIASRQTALLQSVVRHCPALSKEDLSSILTFAVSSAYEQNASSEADVGFSNQLLLSVVESQKCSFRLALEPADLQSLFLQLASLCRSKRLLSLVATSGPSLSSVIDWMNCVIDSRPQAFVLDPKMTELVSELGKDVKQEIEHARVLAEIGIAAEVVKHHLIPAVSAKDQSQLYSIEYLSFAD